MKLMMCLFLNKEEDRVVYVSLVTWNGRRRLTGRYIVEACKEGRRELAVVASRLFLNVLLFHKFTNTVMACSK